MIVVYALTIWWGVGATQSSVAVSDIATMQECQSLGTEMKKDFGWPVQVRCWPYQAPAR